VTEIGVVLNSALALSMIWLLIYFGYRQYRLDKFRHELFELRNELFLYAVDGGISFKNSAYRMLRDRINAQIRFAHFITLTRAVLFANMHRRQPLPRAEQIAASWSAARQGLDDDARKKMDSITERVTRTVTYHLVTGAAPLAVLVGVMGILVKVAKLFHRTEESTTLRVAKELNIELLEEQAIAAQQQERELCEIVV